MSNEQLAVLLKSIYDQLLAAKNEAQSMAPQELYETRQSLLDNYQAIPMLDPIVAVLQSLDDHINTLTR